MLVFGALDSGRRPRNVAVSFHLITSRLADRGRSKGCPKVDFMEDIQPRKLASNTFPSEGFNTMERL